MQQTAPSTQPSCKRHWLDQQISQSFPDHPDWKDLPNRQDAVPKW